MGIPPIHTTPTLWVMWGVMSIPLKGWVDWLLGLLLVREMDQAR